MRKVICDMCDQEITSTIDERPEFAVEVYTSAGSFEFDMHEGCLTDNTGKLGVLIQAKLIRAIARDAVGTQAFLKD